MSRFRHTTVIVGLLITAIILASCEKEVIAVDPDILYDVDSLKEDFLEFRIKLTQGHPNIGVLGDNYAVSDFFDSIDATIDHDMTISEFFFTLRQAAARLHCGHTRIYFAEEYQKGIRTLRKHFPFRVHYSNDSAYIQYDYSDEQTIPEGSRIVSINNKPMSDFVAGLTSLIGADGDRNVYKVAEMNRITMGLIPGDFTLPETYTISYIPRGETETQAANIAALPYDTIIHRRDSLHPEKYYDPPIQFKILKEPSVAVFTLSDFGGWYDYEDIFKELFDTLLASQTPNLIIDVRNNDGGDPYVATTLLNYIIDTPYVYFSKYVMHHYGYDDLAKPIEPAYPNFDGNLFVLADGGSFSTTGHFLSHIRYQNLGTIVGDTAGGNYICNGCYDFFELPHTKLTMMYPMCQYLTYHCGILDSNCVFPTEHLVPDTIIKPTIEDIVNDRDPVMDFVLERIKEKDIQ